MGFYEFYLVLDVILGYLYMLVKIYNYDFYFIDKKIDI